MDESWVDWLISLVGISFIFYDVMEVSSQSVEAVYRLPKNMKEKDKLKSSMTQNHLLDDSAANLMIVQSSQEKDQYIDLQDKKVKIENLEEDIKNKQVSIDKIDKKMLLNRNFYTIEDMNRIMDYKTALKSDYFLTVDVNSTLILNRYDRVIENYATAELREDHSVFSSIASLLGNFFFLLRIIVFQVTLVALPHSPHLQIIILSANEVFYLGINLRNTIKISHLKHLHIMLAKIIQSLFLLTFLITISILTYNYSYNKSARQSQKIQNFAIFTMVVGMCFEFLFLFIGIFFIVKNSIQILNNSRANRNKSREQIKKELGYDPDDKENAELELVRKNKDYVVYHWKSKIEVEQWWGSGPESPQVIQKLIRNNQVNDKEEKQKGLKINQIHPQIQTVSSKTKNKKNTFLFPEDHENGKADFFEKVDMIYNAKMLNDKNAGFPIKFKQIDVKKSKDGT